jgi:uncharacterized protein (DUF924 family)
MTSEDLVSFWLAAGETRWFLKDAAFDGALSVRFREALEAARAGACDDWAGTPRGALGLVLLLDQVSRNINRGSPLAFAADARALRLARTVVSKGWHRAFPAPQAMWFIMPFEHAEDIAEQHRAVALFGTMGLGEMVRYARIHLDIIAKFGRFPHRNPVLGRKSTPAEIAFLKAGGFAG